MNILPKKSWHVRNKDNVAKVRKDEEEARMQEKEQEKRIALAEQQARTSLLRKNSRLKNKVDEIIDNPLVPSNFFEGYEKGKNLEHEAELKNEKEEAEKKIGLLTYLGQGSVEKMTEDEVPWYFKAPSSSKLKSETAEVKRKSGLDPFEDMNELLTKKKKMYKKEISHRHKSKKPKKSSSDPKDKLAQMRKERLEREKREKDRSINLLHKHYGTKPKQRTPPLPDFEPKYNSQFNPHLARNNKR